MAVLRLNLKGMREVERSRKRAIDELKVDPIISPIQTADGGSVKGNSVRTQINFSIKGMDEDVANRQDEKTQLEVINEGGKQEIIPNCQENKAKSG